MKLKRSTVIPLCLLAYLAVMSYIGYPEFQKGNYLYYFGIIITTLCVILLLHFAMKKRERLRSEREQDIERSSRNRD